MTETFPIRRTTTSPSRTTGRSAIRWMPRIATSGWLISGVTNRPAALPALVTVNVPPRSSSGFERARVRGLGEAPHLGVELVEREPVGAADDRDDEPLLGLDGDADVVAVEQHELVVLDARVQLRELVQRLGDRLEHERDEPLQVDVREVALLDPRHGRDLAVRARQVLEHQPPDAAQRHARPFGPVSVSVPRHVRKRRRGRPPR